jgi:succinate dehydrogenase/fumarate reductase flavoprotein subunit
MATTKQLDTIMKHLQTVGSITNREAIVEYNIMSLPRRILDLEAYGVKFSRVRKTHPVTGQRYVRYHLINEHNAA